MLIVSRAVRTLIKKHAWQHPGQYSFGLLLGVKKTLFAALPIGHVADWSQLDIDFLDNEIWPRAFQLSAATHLSIVGCYGSYPEHDESDRPGPWHTSGIYVEYQLEDTPANSSTSYFQGTRYLAEGYEVVLSSGANLVASVNQRRILQQWNQLLERRSYRDSFQSASLTS